MLAYLLEMYSIMQTCNTDVLTVGENRGNNLSYPSRRRVELNHFKYVNLEQWATYPCWCTYVRYVGVVGVASVSNAGVAHLTKPTSHFGTLLFLLTARSWGLMLLETLSQPTNVAYDRILFAGACLLCGEYYRDH